MNWSFLLFLCWFYNKFKSSCFHHSNLSNPVDNFTSSISGILPAIHLNSRPSQIYILFTFIQSMAPSQVRRPPSFPPFAALKDPKYRFTSSSTTTTPIWPKMSFSWPFLSSSFAVIQRVLAVGFPFHPSHQFAFPTLRLHIHQFLNICSAKVGLPIIPNNSIGRQQCTIS